MGCPYTTLPIARYGVETRGEGDCRPRTPYTHILPQNSLTWHLDLEHARLHKDKNSADTTFHTDQRYN